MTGLYAKYLVKRVDGRDRPGGDRTNAQYFVLDYIHDSHARKALSAYAESIHAENPRFAREIRQLLIDSQ